MKIQPYDLLQIQELAALSRMSPVRRRGEVLSWPCEPAPDYDRAFERAEAVLRERRTVLEKERAEAAGLYAELLGKTPEVREMLLRNHRRFQTWGLLEVLTEQSQGSRICEPAQGEELGHLALVLAGTLDEAYYGAERIADLRARVWGQIANHRRALADFRGAEEAFYTAFAYLEEGTGDVLERAILLDLRSSLLREQRRFPEAERLLRQAQRIFRETGEKHRAGRNLIKLSTIHNHAGTPERSILVLFEALKLIDPERDPRLLLVARHNLITNLAEMGRFMEAQGLFMQSRALYARFGDGWTQNRRRWVEGRIAWGLGQTVEAESLLRAARDGFLVEEVAYDTALVSMDLALLYAEQGRTEELRRVAEEMIPIFSSREIHREALAALSLWTRAVREERANLDMVVRVASYLKRAQHNPKLRFEDLT